MIDFIQKCKELYGSLFTGTIERIILKNVNFYRILLLDIEDTNARTLMIPIIVTGTLADVIEEKNTLWEPNTPNTGLTQISVTKEQNQLLGIGQILL